MPNQLRRVRGFTMLFAATAGLAGCASEQDRAIKQMIADRQSRDSAPRVGDPAPTFALNTKDGATEVKLADRFSKRPVVLIFGSYT